jgi:hypothetical protein
MKIKLHNMKKIFFTWLVLSTALSTIYAQKGINFSRTYSAGRKLMMCIDSSAKKVYYDNKFPNQPQTSFSYLPEVKNLSIQIYFDRKENVQQYRYTILEDNKPIVVNKTIDPAQLTDVEIPDPLRFTSLGIFPVKGKNITTLLYSVENPLNVYKSVFYGKTIPRAKIKGFSKLTKSDKGFSYSWVTEPRKSTNFTFSKQDLELTIVKDKSDIDYIYFVSIKDKQTDSVIFKSTTWEYGGIIDEHDFLPYVKIDKSVFKKSGNYEIIIQPSSFTRYNMSLQELEKYTTRHTLTIKLEEENYTKKDLYRYTLIIALSMAAAFIAVLYLNKRRSKSKLAEEEQQKNTAKLQLNTIRAQLNPHFLFNALSGIQNLMNKNETDNANKYLAKFARLTRNVLDDKELISLSQEKSLLDDYLQMEQLRFGFTYEINHTENLDLDNIEIPSMLLQPFVENAVKHGISHKAAQGKIIIGFVKKNQDLLLTVNDNGNGFDMEKKSNGLGLVLSDSRIALLNSIYKENRFILTIKPSNDGTEISLTLTDWL